MTNLSFCASLHIFIGGLGLLLYVTVIVYTLIRAQKPITSAAIYKLSDIVGGTLTSLVLFCDGCFYFAYNFYNHSCYKYYIIYFLWLFPLITNNFSILGLSVDKYRRVKCLFHQPVERLNIFTNVWLMVSWFTAVAAIIIIGGHTTQKQVQDLNDNTFYWERGEVIRSNRGLLENLWAYNSNSDWSSDYRENAIIGLIYGIIGGNISHQALEKFHGNAYNANMKTSNFNIIKQFHTALGITKDDFQNVFGSDVNDGLPHTQSGNVNEKTLSYWEKTTTTVNKINGHIAITRPVEAYSKPVAFTRPGETFVRPDKAFTRPGVAFTRPGVAVTRPLESLAKPAVAFIKPVIAFTRPVEPESLSKPAVAFTRPVEVFTKPNIVFTRPVESEENSNITKIFLPTLKDTISILENKDQGAQKPLIHTSAINLTYQTQESLNKRQKATTPHPLNTHLKQNITASQLWTSIQKLLRNSTNLASSLSSNVSDVNQSNSLSTQDKNNIPSTTENIDSSSSQTTYTSLTDPTKLLTTEISSEGTTGQFNSQEEVTTYSKYTNIFPTTHNFSYSGEDLSSKTPVNESVSPLSQGSVIKTCISQDGFLPVYITIIFTGAFVLPLLISGVHYVYSEWSINHSSQNSQTETGLSAQGSRRALMILAVNIICWTPLLIERLLHAWGRVPNLSVIVPSLFFLLTQVYNVLRALLYLSDHEEIQAKIPSGLFLCNSRCNTAVNPINDNDLESSTGSIASQNEVYTNSRGNKKNTWCSSARSSNAKAKSPNTMHMRVLTPR